MRFSARAVCAVLGGPQYPVTVSGRASGIRYRLEQHRVECGGHVSGGPAAGVWSGGGGSDGSGGSGGRSGGSGGSEDRSGRGRVWGGESSWSGGGSVSSEGMWSPTHSSSTGDSLNIDSTSFCRRDQSSTGSAVTPPHRTSCNTGRPYTASCTGSHPYKYGYVGSPPYPAVSGGGVAAAAAQADGCCCALCVWQRREGLYWRRVRVRTYHLPPVGLRPVRPGGDPAGAPGGPWRVSTAARLALLYRAAVRRAQAGDTDRGRSEEEEADGTDSDSDVPEQTVGVLRE